MMASENEVKNRVLEMGADFVGIAPASRFEAAPEFSKPDKLLPEFRSVVVFGIAMNRGALEGWFSKRNRRPLVLHDRLAMEEIDRISLKLSRWLERQGFKSAYISQNVQYNLFRGRPDFSHKHAAAAAGLGRLGLSSNFVQNEFGAAVHIASVITEADLSPDPMVSDEDNPCHQCKSCIKICPVDAMSQEREKSFMMEGREYTHRWVNKLACGWGCAGLSGHRYQIGSRTVGTWAYNDLPIPNEIREFSLRFMEADRHRRHPMEKAEIVFNNGTEYCGNCAKICVGDKEGTAALFKMHLNSGLAKIPEDPTMILNLKSANTRLESYHIPEEEIAGLFQK